VDCGEDDLALIARRLAALEQLIGTENGKNFVGGYRRASDILAEAAEQDGRHVSGKPDPRLYLQKEERELAVALSAARTEAQRAVERGDFCAAMHAVASLRPLVDAFLDHVDINVPASDRRENRLRLLGELRGATLAVADFSKIEV